MQFITWRVALMALMALAANTIGLEAPALAQQTAETQPPPAVSDEQFNARLQEFDSQILEAEAANDFRNAWKHVRDYRDFVLSVREETHPDALQARFVELRSRLKGGVSRPSLMVSDADKLLDNYVQVHGEENILAGYAFDLAGSAYLSNAQSNEALVLFARAMDIFDKEQGPGHPESQRIRINYIEAMLASGRAAEAIPLLIDTFNLDLEANGQSSQTVIPILTNLGVAHFQMGQNAKALEYTKVALDTQREVFGDRHPHTLGLWHNYAVLLASIGKLEEARNEFRRFISVFEDEVGQFHPDTIAAWSSYLQVLEKSGDTDFALRIAAAMFRRSDFKFGEKHLNTVKARVMWLGLRLRHEGPSEDLVSRLFRESLGFERFDTARLVVTRTQVEERSPFRFNLLMSGPGAAAARADHRGVPSFEASVLRADTMWLYRKMVEENGAPKSRYPMGPRNALEALQNAMRTAVSGPAARVQARLRASQRNSGRIFEDWEKSLAERQDLERQLFETFGGSGRAIADRAWLHFQLEVNEGSLRYWEDVLNHNIPGFFEVMNAQTVASYSLDNLLDDDEVALLVVPSMTGTHVVAYSNSDIAWNRSDMTVDEVNSIVADLREGLGVDEAGQLGYFDMGLSHELYSSLIEPVAHALEGQTKLYFIAQGSLATLPPAVLLTEAPPEDADYDDAETLRSAAWLSDDFALIQLPTLETLELLRSTIAWRRGLEEESAKNKFDNPTYSGFGDPTLAGKAALRGVGGAVLRAIDPRSFIRSDKTAKIRSLIDPELVRAMPRLPGTRREVEAVRTGLDASGDLVFYDDAMTEAQIKKTDFTGVEILHLATHGVTAAQSQGLAEPGLIFTPPAEPSETDDGYLSAAEVVDLDLASVRWVILSACNTAAPSGRPEGGGFSGLVRSFFLAGASTLLVSHWPVYDDVAAELIARAVKYNDEGLSRAQALQKSMREVRMAPEFDAAHPAVWAPFALIGEGR